MRPIMLILAGVGVGLTGTAQAQSARNTPEGIVCAMTGSCDAPAAADTDRMEVGKERAFSLARPTGQAAQPQTQPQRQAATPAARPRGYVAPVRSARRPATAVGRVQPGGGLDMLVTFQKGSAVMTPQAQAEARAFAQAMAAPQMSGMRFAIEGHTDSSGSRQLNQELSQQRAQAVMDYLVAQGVDAGRLSARGYGPDRPLAGRSASAPANRRVEFVKRAN